MKYETKYVSFSIIFVLQNKYSLDLSSFATSGTTYPLTHHNFPKNLKIQSVAHFTKVGPRSASEFSYWKVNFSALFGNQIPDV